MDPEEMKKLHEEIKAMLDGFVGDTLPGMVEDTVKEKIAKRVTMLEAQRQASGGMDMTGVSHEEKLVFAENLKSFFTKSLGHSSEITEEGGLLIPEQIYRGIERITETTGHILEKAKKFPLQGISQISIPRETGGVIRGSYLGIDEQASPSTVRLGSAQLTPKQWSLLFPVDRRLLANASVSMVDLIMNIIAESLSFEIDYQGFVGVKPNTGIFNDPDVPVLTLDSGNTDFEDINADILNDMILSVKKSARTNSAFYMHSTVLGLIQKLKDEDKRYLVTQPNPLSNFNYNNVTLSPDGFIWNKPIFTLDDILPSTDDSAADTKFIVFGDLSRFAYGDRGSMEIGQSDSATIGNVNMYAANQVALRALHEHALAMILPAAFVTIKTSAS